MRRNSRFYQRCAHENYPSQCLSGKHRVAVVQYFDAHPIGLTTMPTMQTIGFLRQSSAGSAMTHDRSNRPFS